MTEDKQRIAIAKLCGWKIEQEPNAVTGRQGRYRTPDGFTVLRLSNYCHDLNAMHEAEKVLDPHPMEGEVANYHNWITTICGSIEAAVSATARQRAEAFLRALNLWKD